MTTTTVPYPKRLIEVDLPIRRISAHARREKSIRHGHISTLHIWWARRPLAACRAVICAALWLDPADPLCPGAFRAFAREQMQSWANHNRHFVSGESLPRIDLTRENPAYLDDPEHLRLALLDFIADFANWDNSTKPQYLETSRALTQAAHEALGGEPGTRPLVVDPFAGGGAIPLEALRVGADVFASDLNPVAFLLNKVVLEYIPKYGQRLADEVRKWGKWIQEQAEKELAELYPKDPDGATPIAYLWARTIRCEGPGCGAEVPLIRSLWLAKHSKNAVALRLVPNPAEKRVEFEIIHNAKAKDVGEGPVRKGAATCPVCGFTTAVAAIRQQLKLRSGGARDARLFAIVTVKQWQMGREYRLPTSTDLRTSVRVQEKFENLRQVHSELPPIPNEPLPPVGTLGFRVQQYGVRQWGDLFTQRQLLLLSYLVRFVDEAASIAAKQYDSGFASALRAVLACAVDREAEHSSSLCRWNSAGQKMQATFGRQALPMVWDFCETNPFGSSVGSLDSIIELVLIPFETVMAIQLTGQVHQASADYHVMPDSVANAFVTDPPYYDAVPYADLSDFFYIWLKRTLPGLTPQHAADELTPKDNECIVDIARGKDRAHFERLMATSMAEGRRILRPNGIATIVFAHKTTTGWETQLQAMVDAGWIVSGSWPIDTEMATRLRAMESAALASSVHLVCRPRDTSTGQRIGDWREVLAELPQRIHEWMPRLVAEGIVGADAIFACLGPAIEIFSRYERVEKASGEVVTLREYLSYVWTAVSHEALSAIFEEADATGFEEDARLTALWLWTLFGGVASQPSDVNAGEDADVSEDDDEAPNGKPAAGGSYVIEFDAARKIAQGLGAHLDKLATVVEIKGEKARLIPVAERARILFGNEHAHQPVIPARKHSSSVVQGALPGFPTKPQQGSFADLFGDATLGEDGATASDEWIDPTLPDAGTTVLDRLHQSMLLFASGRGEALRRFLVENGIGQDERFWRLAQALSALYPMGSDEKRWVDGVLARKKGWGM